MKAGRRAAVLAAAVVATPAVARAQDGGALDFRGRFEALAVNAEGLPAPERLHALFDLAWERSMTWFPEFATYVGYAEGDHGAWTDMSLEAIQGREERLGDPLAVLEAIPRDSLGPEDRLSYDLFRRDTEVDVEGARFPAELLAINQLGGVRGRGHCRSTCWRPGSATGSRSGARRSLESQQLPRSSMVHVTQSSAGDHRSRQPYPHPSDDRSPAVFSFSPGPTTSISRRKDREVG